MRVDKQTIKQAYELGEGTFKKLSEEYEVSQGTIKSWAKQDRDNNDPWIKPTKPNSKLNTKNQSKKVENKVEVEEEVSWMDIEKEYITDIRKKPCTMEDLSKKYNIPFKTVEDYSYKNKWSERRGKYQGTVREETLRKTSDKVSDEFSTINANLIATLTIAASKGAQAIEGELTLESVRDMNGKYSTEDFGIINSKKMKELVDSIRIIQDSIFKGFGKDKEIERAKLDIAREKLALEKMKVNGSDEETEDDGFIDALNGQIGDVWDED